MKQAISPLLQIGVCTVGYISATGNTTLAQVIPDNTVNTQVNQNENTAKITGGATRGNNLFHSFQEFSIPNGDTAFFNNADNITNIFSRVTGGNISEINGIIRANGEANLFLLNPAGIIFRQNAALDIGGSFLATTADSIIFADDIEFSASDTTQEPLLTVNMPVGLNLPDNSGEIKNYSVSQDSNSEEVGLQVPDGKSLFFVGGNLTLDDGKIFAPGGNVQLAAIAGKEIVGLENNDNKLRLNITEDIQKADIFLRDRSTINVSGTTESIIDLKARNIEISEFSQLFAQSNTDFVDSQAGAITLQATETIQIGRNVINGGSINFQSQFLFLDGTSLIASNLGQKDSGDITLKTSESILITGGSIRNQTKDVSGGDINIQANSFSLADGARLSTVTIGSGKPGNVNIQAQDSVLISGVDPVFGLSSGISTNVNSVQQFSL